MKLDGVDDDGDEEEEEEEEDERRGGQWRGLAHARRCIVRKQGCPFVVALPDGS